MKNIIQFHVYKSDSHYVAEGADLAIITQGKTLDELMNNLKEAVELHLDGENLSDLGLSEKPLVLTNFEFPALVHAQT